VTGFAHQAGRMLITSVVNLTLIWLLQFIWFQILNSVPMCWTLDRMNCGTAGREIHFSLSAESLDFQGMLHEHPPIHFCMCASNFQRMITGPGEIKSLFFVYLAQLTVEGALYLVMTPASSFLVSHHSWPCILSPGTKCKFPMLRDSCASYEWQLAWSICWIQ